MTSSLDLLLQDSRIWRGSDWQLTAQPGLPSGFAALDQALPGGGWPRSSLIELQHDSHGLGEIRLLWPTLAAITRTAGQVVLVDPPFIPYAPAWAAAGIELGRLLWLALSQDEQRLWAFEQSLRSGACRAALLWLEHEPDSRSWRRLQLAADEGDCIGWVILRSAQVRRASPVSLRLRLSQQALPALQILKRRGPPLLQPLFLPELNSISERIAAPRQQSFAPLRRVHCLRVPR